MQFIDMGAGADKPLGKHWRILLNSLARPRIPNARFWTWTTQGWVKLTLKPHQSLETSYAGDSSGEGWSTERTTWHHAGDCVIRSWAQEGRDCDGGYGHYGIETCSLEELASVEVDDGTLVPNWQSESRSQYDQFAEAAGY